MIFTNKAQLFQALPKNGRLLALDIGTKRIGVAISDEDRFIATPKLIINRQSNLKDFAKIAEFISTNLVCAIIIGLPLNMNESNSKMAEFVKKFGENLDDFFEKKLPIIFFDERLTSFEARNFNSSQLSRKKNKFFDDIAASLILQHFLQS